MLSTILFVVAAVLFALDAYKKQTLLPLGLALCAVGFAL